MRKLPYQGTPSNQVSNLIEQVVDGTLKFYVVSSSGPTNYLLKEQDGKKKFKVLIGTMQNCSCMKGLTKRKQQRENDVCGHVLFVMLKVFRLPKDSSVVWQPSLLDKEVEDILHGRLDTMKKGMW